MEDAIGATKAPRKLSDEVNQVTDMDASPSNADTISKPLP